MFFLVCSGVARLQDYVVKLLNLITGCHSPLVHHTAEGKFLTQEKRRTAQPTEGEKKKCCI
jgi:hypothetical protein